MHIVPDGGRFYKRLKEGKAETGKDRLILQGVVKITS